MNDQVIQEVVSATPLVEPKFKMDIQLFGSVANQQTHAGHTILIKIDGQEVGRIQSGDGDVSFGQEGVYEIGSIMPQEHVPLRYEGGFTVEKFLIRKKSLANMGLAALGEDILKMDVIDIEVLDKYTGDTVVVYEGCSLQSYRRSFRANALAGENASWVYLNSR
jgi:hypothetical protein